MPETPRQLLRTYLQTLYQFAGIRAIKATGLLFLSGLFQGISLLMLIPLLGLTGLSNSPAASDRISQTIQSLMNTLGIPYSLSGILLLFLAIITAEALFTRYRSIMLNGLSLDFTHYLRNRLYQRMGSASWQFHSRNHSSEAIQLLDNAVNKISSASFFILQLFVLISQAMVFLLVASSLSLTMTLVMLLTGLLLYALLIPLNKKIFRQGKNALASSQALYRNMGDFFSGLKLAKSYNRSDRHIQEFEQTGRHLLNNEKAVFAASASAQMWLRFISVSLLCIFVYVALNRMQMGIERLLVMIVVVNRLYGVFSSGQRYWQALLQALPSFDTYQQAMSNFTNHEEPAQTPNASIPPLQSAIRLQNISFQYHQQYKDPAISNLSVSFPANQTTAITGPSGSGKSTLADILMGLLIPDSGALYIDDQQLMPDQLASWRQHIAYVPQEVYLFDASIRANLQWISDAQYDDQQLQAALQAAAAEDFVAKLPDQLDTKVGERGVKLSGGERQRIALARALLKQPDLLILDEATSALDQQNEDHIRDALKKLHGSMTIIIIAHRQSTIKHADHVISL